MASELIFIADLIAIFSIYLIINLSLNLEFGYAGLPNFGKVLAVGAGAIVMGVLPLHVYRMILNSDADPIHDNFELVSQINEHITSEPGLAIAVFGMTLAVAIAVGAGLGAASAYPAIRLRGDYLAIVLLAFGEMIRIIGTNYEGLVGGTLGVAIPDFVFISDEYKFLITSLILLGFAGVVFVFVSRMTRSPVRRLLCGIRDDQTSLASLGHNVVRIKIKTMMIAGGIAAVGGLLYAGYVEGVVAMGYNRLNWTFLPFIMVIVGGMANNRGVIVGTLLFVGVRKLVIYYNDYFEGYLPFDIIWLDYLLLGGIMILVLIYKPRGLLPEKKAVYKDS